MKTHWIHTGSVFACGLTVCLASCSQDATQDAKSTEHASQPKSPAPDDRPKTPKSEAPGAPSGIPEPPRPPDTPKYELAVNWKAGYRYRFAIEFEKSFELTSSQFPQPIRQQELDRQEFVFEASDGRDGGKVLTYYVTKLEGEVRRAGQREPHSASSDPALAAMLNKKAEYHVDSEGNLQRIEGLDRIVAEFNRDLPEEMHGVGEAYYGEDAMSERYLATFVRSLPTRAVAIGDAWNHRAEVTLPLGVMQTDYTHTLRRVEGEVSDQLAHVAIEASIELKGEWDIFGMKMRLDESRGTGTLVFDCRKEMICNHQTTQAIAGTFSTIEDGKELTGKITATSGQTTTLLGIEPIDTADPPGDDDAG